MGCEPGPTPHDAGGEGSPELQEERRRLRRLKALVDFTAQVLMQGRVGRAEAERLVAEARSRALELFPDKTSTYDLILAPRFARLMDEFVGSEPSPPAPAGPNVLPFARR